MAPLPALTALRPNQWSIGPRIATGKESLYKSALHGKNAMPAKGGMASAPDADVKAAVDYLVTQAK